MVSQQIAPALNLDTSMRDGSVCGKSRPRLLFLCQTLPFPPDGGVNIRTFNVLRLLSEAYEITALFFYRKGVARDVDSSRRELSKYCDAHVFPIEQEHSKARLLYDHARSVLTGRVYTRFAYESKAFRTKINDVLSRNRFDLVHMDSLDLSGYLPQVRGLPVALVHHNVESDLLDRRAKIDVSRSRAAYLSLQARLMRKEEAKWCSRLPLNVFVSEQDRQRMSTLLPGLRGTVVPNGVDAEFFTPQGEAGQGGIVYVGGTTWFPNKDALSYFANDILPELRALKVPQPVTWVGRSSVEEVEMFGTRGVHLTGYVDDIRPHVASAGCYIVPLRVGGGTRLKILDAWAMGKAIVSTSVGSEGLDARDGENMLIRDDPRSFAQAISLILNDAELRARLGREGRRTVESSYSWNIIRKNLLAQYAQLHS